MSEASHRAGSRGPAINLHAAVYAGDYDAVIAALAQRASINEVHAGTGLTPLQIAVGTDKLDIAKYLVQEGAKLLPDTEGRMPSILATSCRVSMEMVDFITDAEIAAENHLEENISRTEVPDQTADNAQAIRGRLESFTSRFMALLLSKPTVQSYADFISSTLADLQTINQSSFLDGYKVELGEASERNDVEAMTRIIGKYADLIQGEMNKAFKTLGRDG